MGIQVPPDSTGKVVETFSPDGATQRQVNIIGDDTTAAARAKVGNADPGATDYGLTTRDVRGNASLPVRTDPTGTTAQPVSAASLPLPAGAATAAKQPALGTAGAASADVISVQGIAGGTALPVSGTVNAGPVTSGGLASYHVVAAGSNNAAVVKNAVGQVYGWNVFNNAGYPVYVKLYNKATAPAPATDNALLLAVIAVQAGTGRDVMSDLGMAFAAGIGIAIVKGIGDTDNTAVVASDCVVDIFYK